MKSNELRLLFELAQNKGCKFTNFTYRSTESGELASHTVLFGIDYKAAIQRDLKYLGKLRDIVGKKKYGAPGAALEFQAIEELISSLEKSLKNYDGTALSKEAAEKDTYESVFPGIKQHKDTGAYYLYGLALKKKVIEPGKNDKKTVKSKDLTIAKDKIRARLRTNRYRQFRLNSINKAVVNGNALILE